MSVSDLALPLLEQVHEPGEWVRVRGQQQVVTSRRTSQLPRDELAASAVRPELERLGELLDAERRALMHIRTWRLTTTCNHGHDPCDINPAIVSHRELHREIDEAVLAAYGGDRDLEIGHHPTKIGLRWTVSPLARFELFCLLLEENHRRAGLPGETTR